MSLNSGETLQPFKPLNQLIYDSVGNLIGIQNDRANGTDLRSVSTMTWANRPTAAPDAGLYLFTDIGASGTLMRYAGGRWRPLAGQAQLASLGAAVTGIANSEQIVLQTLIPAGAWQDNDVVWVHFTGSKSGGTDVYRATIRIGTAGTTADTALTGMSGFSIMAATSTTGGWDFPIKLVSATSALRVGNASSNVSAIGDDSNNPLPAATTITNASANALYVSLSVYSGGASDTVGIQTGNIRLITP